MARIRFDRVTKRYGNVLAVDALDLDIPDREFVVLLGPSGCGKTTTLNMIAGLEELSAGDIYFDDEIVTCVPPHRRDVAMVFQSTARPEFLKPGDNKPAGDMALGLAPIPRGAGFIARTEPLRDNPFGADSAHMLEQYVAPRGYVIEIDQARTLGLVESRPQQRLPLFDPAAAQVMAVQVQQIEGEIDEPIRPAPGDGVLQIADLRDTAIVGHRDLAVEHDLAVER